MDDAAASKGIPAMRTSFVLALLAPLALAACGKPEEKAAGSEAAGSAAPAAPAVAAAGTPPADWGKCAVCHTNKPGINAVGPTLFAVVGRKAGSVPGYAYSDANKASGLTWDEATLDEYLTAPMKKVPGTKMVFAGISDPAERKTVIDYLKTLK
jgi:cytochrome c